MAGERPRFLLYRQGEHAAARANDYIRALVEYVEYEQNEATVAVLHAVRERNFEESFYLLAKADALGSVVDQFWKEDPIVMAVDEDDDVDPALPPSVRSPNVTRTE